MPPAADHGRLDGAVTMEQDVRKGMRGHRAVVTPRMGRE
jgi:hypothetical protein